MGERGAARAPWNCQTSNASPARPGEPWLLGAGSVTCTIP